MKQPTAAVIGSGFGGLTLAVRLQAAGIQTTVIEKRDKPGGRAYVTEDKGYTFDGGPTIITAPPSLEEVRDRVIMSWRRELRDAHLTQALAALRARYDVVVADGSTTEARSG